MHAKCHCTTGVRMSMHQSQGNKRFSEWQCRSLFRNVTRLTEWHCTTGTTMSMQRSWVLAEWLWNVTMSFQSRKSINACTMKTSIDRIAIHYRSQNEYTYNSSHYRSQNGYMNVHKEIKGFQSGNALRRVRIHKTTKDSLNGNARVLASLQKCSQSGTALQE